MMFRTSIRKKNIIFFSSFVTIFLIILFGFSFYFIQNKFDEHIRTKTKIELETRTQIIKNMLGSSNRLFYYLTSSINLKENLLSVPKNLDEVFLVKEKIRNNLISFMYFNNEYKLNIYINHKLEMSKYYESLGLYDLSNLSYQILSDEVVVNEEWFNYENRSIFKIPNKDEVFIIQKIKDLNNKDDIATIVISIKNSKLISYINTDSVTENTTFILLNDKNEILVSNNKEYENKLLFDFKINSNNNIITKKYINRDIRLVYITPDSDIVKFVSQILKPLVLIEITLIILCIFATVIFGYYISGRITKLSKKISNIDTNSDLDKNYFNEFKEIELKIISDSILELHYRNSSLLDKVKEEVEKNKLKELEFLQAQINPHFLFNAMDYISFEALMSNQLLLSDTISLIAEILRYSILNPNKQVDILEEIENIKKYLKIYNLRYENKIDFIYNTKEDYKLKIPKFILQPLIENSVMHGWKDRNKKLNISINVEKKENYYEIQVKDDGSGEDANKLNSYLKSEIYLKTKNGLGIKNINERLSIVYGNDSFLMYSNDKNGKLIAHIRIC